MDRNFINYEAIIKNEIDQTFKERVEYFEELKNIALAKDKFLKHGTIDTSQIREEVAESWLRSKKKVDPYKNEVSHLSAQDLNESLDKNKLLVKCGLFVMESIYKTLNHPFYIMHIADKHGTLLCINDDYNKDHISRHAIRPGASFAEEVSGTNSISLSLIHNTDMVAHGAEHYFTYQHNVTCTTSLIRDDKNRIIGTVTLTFNVDMYDKLLLTISEIAARMIEKEIKKHTLTSVLDTTINNSLESIIILDSKLQIVTANSKFLDLLNINDETVKTLDIEALLPDLNFKDNVNKIVTSDIREIHLYYNNRQYNLSYHARLALNDFSFDYIILFFQEITSLIYMSRKFSGKYNYYTFNDIITQDEVMLKLIEDSKRLSNLDVPILLTGNSGTGKELFAQSIHSYSNRASKPFMAVNCAALPGNLIESELFGYDKGAFTGAQTGKPGKFELADGGTIFLDEIGELPLDVQAKILRFLDDYKVSRIGGMRVKLLDVRVIAATNRDLNEEVLNKSFRLDLFYRLNVLNIHIPPLNDRDGDIIYLCEHFIKILNEKNPTMENKYIPDEVIDYLDEREWPGNIRELQNAITKAFYLSDGPEITLDYFTPKTPNLTLNVQSDQVVAKSEEQMIIENALKRHRGVAEASKYLHIPISSFYRKMKKYNIKRDIYRTEEQEEDDV
jgi:transcriptional regulator with PAS, ATPase and Fis domain